MSQNALTSRIIAAAIEVHKTTGPGLLESAYEECFCHELTLCGIPYKRQSSIPMEYKGIHLECGYRLDLIVDNTVVVELKACDALMPIHEAQLLTYMRLGHWKLGLLINFNTLLLKDGVRRLIL
jgi:GxxExxY protein